MTQAKEISDPDQREEGEALPCSPPLTEERILAWLEENPDFFQHHPHLMSNLSPGPGNVAHIDHLRVEQLQRENQQLRDELAGMLALIGRNEGIYRQFHAIEGRMAAARDLDALILSLARGLEDAFGLERVSVVLASDLEFGVTLGEEARLRCFFVPGEELARVYPQPPRSLVRIGLEGLNRGLFFGMWADRIRSEVLTPLFHKKRLVGSLNLGAASPTRFLPSYSTDLLGNLADFFVDCLSRVLVWETGP